MATAAAIIDSPSTGFTDFFTIPKHDVDKIKTEDGKEVIIMGFRVLTAGVIKYRGPRTPSGSWRTYSATDFPASTSTYHPIQMTHLHTDTTAVLQGGP